MKKEKKHCTKAKQDSDLINRSSRELGELSNHYFKN